MKEIYDQIIKAANQSFETGNMEQLIDLCTEDIEWNMVGKGTWRGKTEILRGMKQMMEENPGMQLPTIHTNQVLIEGDHAAVIGSSSYDDMVKKIHVTMDYVDRYDFRDNKIEKLTTYVLTKSKPLE